jgi:hypothetical protein
MTGLNGRSMMLALRAWLDESDGDRNAERLAEHVIGRALAGHFGYFKLLLDMVDGKLHPTSEEEMTFEPECPVIVADDGRASRNRRAA